MTKYKQLSQEQRYVIGRLLKAGNTKQEIATAVGCHKSTIGRELKRNTPQRGRGAKLYKPDKAQQKTELWHKTKPKGFSFTADMRKQIVKWLTVEKLSPELITAKGRQEYGDFSVFVGSSERDPTLPYIFIVRWLKIKRFTGFIK